MAPYTPTKKKTVNQNKKKTNKVKNEKKKKSQSPKLRMTKKKAQKLLNFLTALKPVSGSSLSQLAPYFNKEAYDMLSDATLNSIYSKSIPEITRQRIKRALQSKKDMIRTLSKRSVSLNTRRKILPQVGGSLGLIIASVLPVLANFLRSQKII